MHPRIIGKLLNLSIVFVISTTFYSLVAYFSQVAKEHFGMTETQIGYVFSSFPFGYIAVSFAMSLCSIGHWPVSRINILIRVGLFLLILVFVAFSFVPPMMKEPHDGGGRGDTNNTLSTTSSSHQQSFWPAVKSPAAATHSPSPSSLPVDFPYDAWRVTVVFASLRVGMGACVALIDQALLVYIVKVFPTEVSTVVGEWEGAAGLGCVLGPPVGGVLYDAGGFTVPLLVTGGIALLLGLATWMVGLRLGADSMKPERETKNHNNKRRHSNTPNGADEGVGGIHVDVKAGEAEQRDNSQEGREDESEQEDEEEDTGEEPINNKVSVDFILRLLQQPFCLIAGPCLFSLLTIGSFAFCEALAPLYLKEAYSMGPTKVGLVIGATALLYAFVAIGIGRVVGGARAQYRPHLLVIVAIVCALFTFLIGPCYAPVGLAAEDFGPYSARMFFTVFSFVMWGMCLSAINVAGSSTAVDAARMEDPILVPAAGGLNNICASLGGLLGPSLGAHIVQAYGFQQALLDISASFVAVAAVYWLSYLHKLRTSGPIQWRTSDEKRQQSATKKKEPEVEAVEKVGVAAQGERSALLESGSLSASQVPFHREDGLN